MLQADEKGIWRAVISQDLRGVSWIRSSRGVKVLRPNFPEASSVLFSVKYVHSTIIRRHNSA